MLTDTLVRTKLSKRRDSRGGAADAESHLSREEMGLLDDLQLKVEFATARGHFPVGFRRCQMLSSRRADRGAVGD